MNKPIVLGNKVKDKVSGFTGIAITKTYFLNGCIQYGVAPPVAADGKKAEPEWFDEGQIVFVSKGVTVEPIEDRPGGPPTKIKSFKIPRK